MSAPKRSTRSDKNTRRAVRNPRPMTRIVKLAEKIYRELEAFAPLCDAERAACAEIIRIASLQRGNTGKRETSKPITVTRRPSLRKRGK